MIAWKTVPFARRGILCVPTTTLGAGEALAWKREISIKWEEAENKQNLQWSEHSDENVPVRSWKSDFGPALFPAITREVTVMPAEPGLSSCVRGAPAILLASPDFLTSHNLKPLNVFSYLLEKKPHLLKKKEEWNHSSGPLYVEKRETLYRHLPGCMKFYHNVYILILSFFWVVNYECGKITAADSRLIATEQRLESHNLLGACIEGLLPPSHYNKSEMLSPCRVPVTQGEARRMKTHEH